MNLYCFASNNPIRSTVSGSICGNDTSNYISFANLFFRTKESNTNSNNKRGGLVFIKVFLHFVLKMILFRHFRLALFLLIQNMKQKTR